MTWTLLHRATVLLLPLLLAACARSASAPAVIPQPSVAGLYAVSYSSAIDPVPLNTLHTWTVRVADADGAPVVGALLAVDGGMPAHNHGMPTAPIAAELGNGVYRIEGMKFQMPGTWIVTVTVASSLGTDEVTFPLELP